MNRLALTIASLLIAIIFVGCYTQIGYYKPPHPTRKTSYHRQDDQHHQEETKEIEAEEEEEAQVKAEGEQSEAEDEGYYGHHNPTYGDHDLYYRPYYYDYYPPYPYYGGYHSRYPYYGYYHDSYYSYYGHDYPYGHHRYRYHRHHYSRPRSKIGDLHFGRQRSQSHRGVRSGQPSLRRPSKSAVNRESSPAPARSSSGSQYDRSRRSRRR